MESTKAFRSQNLRRHSFRDAVLEGADFTGADLRKADFTGAGLAGATFYRAKLGVPPLFGVVILVLALVEGAIAGAATGVAAINVMNQLTAESWQGIVVGMSGLVVAALLLIALLIGGFVAALRVYLVAFAITMVIDLTVIVLYGDANLQLSLRAFAVLLLFALATVAGLLGRVVAGLFGAIALTATAVVGGLAAGLVGGGLGVVFVGILLTVMAKRSLEADASELQITIRAHDLIARHSARFTDADVSDANFTGTVVDKAGMARAMLAKARWDTGHEPLLHEPRT